MLIRLSFDRGGSVGQGARRADPVHFVQGRRERVAAPVRCPSRGSVGDHAAGSAPGRLRDQAGPAGDLPRLPHGRGEAAALWDELEGGVEVGGYEMQRALREDQVVAEDVLAVARLVRYLDDRSDAVEGAVGD